MAATHAQEALSEINRNAEAAFKAVVKNRVQRIIDIQNNIIDLQKQLEREKSVLKEVKFEPSEVSFD